MVFHVQILVHRQEYQSQESPSLEAAITQKRLIEASQKPSEIPITKVAVSESILSGSRKLSTQEEIKTLILDALEVRMQR